MSILEIKIDAKKRTIISKTNNMIMNNPLLVKPNTLLRAGISKSGKIQSKSGQEKPEFDSGSSVSGILSISFCRLKGVLIVPPANSKAVLIRIIPIRSRFLKFIYLFRK